MEQHGPHSKERTKGNFNEWKTGLCVEKQEVMTRENVENNSVRLA